MTKLLSEGLSRFFDQYSSTHELVNTLIESKSHAQEILILLCSRIDALSSSAAGEGESSGRSFARFLTIYGGSAELFDSVSVGDVYYELDYHLWMMPGMLEKAGRVRLFSRLSDPILNLLAGSEIALTLRDAERFIKRIQRALRKHFRAKPGQSHKKHILASARQAKDAVLDEFRRTRDAAVRDALSSALDPLIRSKTVARILYEKFRCESIHGGRVPVEESRFFTEKEPYWKPLWADFYGPFHLVEFPAPFLASLLSNCIRNYRKHLEAKGKVPPSVHFEMFPDAPFSHLDLLDENLLPKGRMAIPK